MTLTVGNQLVVQGGTGTNALAEALSSGNQTINAGGVAILGGTAGSGNFAQFNSAGTQSITVGAGGVQVWAEQGERRI